MPPKKTVSLSKTVPDHQQTTLLAKKAPQDSKSVPKVSKRAAQQTVKQDESQTGGDKPAQKESISPEKVETDQQPVKVKKTRSKQMTMEAARLSESTNNTAMWSYGTGVTPNRLLIANWNVNGVRSVLGKGELQKYVESVEPDILCLNETKIDLEAYNKAPIQPPTGYHGYWNFCKCSSGYSGVAIYSKYLPLSVREDLPLKEHSQEGRVLTMEFQKFYLLTAYIPNAGQKLDRLKYRVEEWDTAFQAYCNGLKQVKTVIICGDLNVAHKEIDICNAKTNEKSAGFTKEERNKFSGFLAGGWVDTFRQLYPEQVKYSWWSMRTNGRAKNIGWRLDYFLINKESLGAVKDSRINNDIMGSDHCPVELELELK